MQTFHLPEIGKIYISEVDPTLKIFVQCVQRISDVPNGFFVQGCDPKDVDNENAAEYEFFEDEWASFRFTRAS